MLILSGKDENVILSLSLSVTKYYTEVYREDIGNI